jgi:hypothetical protein
MEKPRLSYEIECYWCKRSLLLNSERLPDRIGDFVNIALQTGWKTVLAEREKQVQLFCSDACLRAGITPTGRLKRGKH